MCSAVVKSSLRVWSARLNLKQPTCQNQPLAIRRRVIHLPKTTNAPGWIVQYVTRIGPWPILWTNSLVYSCANAPVIQCISYALSMCRLNVACCERPTVAAIRTAARTAAHYKHVRYALRYAKRPRRRRMKSSVSPRQAARVPTNRITVFCDGG